MKQEQWRKIECGNSRHEASKGIQSKMLDGHFYRCIGISYAVNSQSKITEKECSVDKKHCTQAQSLYVAAASEL